jgi:hypothetical protein
VKKLTQDLYDKIKAQPGADWQELRDKYNISKTTIMRIRSSATLEESKAKGRHKTTELTKDEVQKQIIEAMKNIPAKKRELEFETEADVANHITEERRKKEEWRQKPDVVRTSKNKKSIVKTTITGGKAKIEIIPKRSLLSRIFRRGK